MQVMDQTVRTTETGPTLTAALKEWAVAIRALREGRQVVLFRKGGIREAEGEFVVEARDVLLFPTFEHQIEQAGGALQPCYGAWQDDEVKRKPQGENVRLDAWATITDIVVVENEAALYRFPMQHIYSDTLLKFRWESAPDKPLYALFLRAYDLAAPVTVLMEMDYYGCRSWVQMKEPVSLEGATPALSDHTYNERVRVLKRLLTEE